jgi:hypothetical protein
MLGYIYTPWKINIDPENHQWKPIFQPLSARVYVYLLEGIVKINLVDKLNPEGYYKFLVNPL